MDSIQPDPAPRSTFLLTDSVAQGGSMLGAQVPSPDHFQTQVARVLFDMTDTQGRIPMPMQNALRASVVRAAALVARGGTRWAPLLRRMDRFVMGYCAGSVKREILADLCGSAPHLLSIMPQCRQNVQALSRALFLSSVLHPAALRRIEDAVMAEILNQG